VNVEDTVHPHEFEDGAHAVGEATQLELPALGVDLAQAGKQSSESRAVDETQPRQIEHDLGLGIDRGEHVTLELGGVACVELLEAEPQQEHVFCPCDFEIHRRSGCTRRAPSVSGSAVDEAGDGNFRASG
jgi:hypothetical protein